MEVISKHEDIQHFHQAEKCRLKPSIIICFLCQFDNYYKRVMLTYVGERVNKHTS